MAWLVLAVSFFSPHTRFVAMAYLASPLVFHASLVLMTSVVFMLGCRVRVGQSRWLNNATALAVHGAAALSGVQAGVALYQGLTPLFWIFPLILLGCYVVLLIFPSAPAQWAFGRARSLATLPAVRVTSFMAVLIAFLVTLTWSRLPTGDSEFAPSNDEYALDSLIQHFGPAESPLWTDQARPIAVLRFTGRDSALIDASLRTFQQGLLSRLGLLSQVIALPVVWLPCNCHGYVFTGGQYWLTSDQVEGILTDNGYRQVKTPAVGDLAIYRDRAGAIVHSGLVRGRGTDTILVESKWGKLGCFIHPSHVYARSNLNVTFYHSSRPGHVLHAVPTASPKPPVTN